MSELRYTAAAPTEPGWYWCRNYDDTPGGLWEAVVYVGHHGIGGLVASWLTSPGKADMETKEKWNKDTEWAGPIDRPLNADRFNGHLVERA